MAETYRNEKPTPVTDPNQNWVLVLIVLSLSAIAGFLILPRIGPKSGRPAIEAAAKDVSLPLVDESTVSTASANRISTSALRGKVIVLDFWASYCGPCLVQAQLLERFNSVPRADVVVVGVNEGEPLARVVQHLKQHKTTYATALDEDGKVGEAYAVTGLPTLVILDKQGRVSSVNTGLVPYARLERLVAEAAR